MMFDRVEELFRFYADQYGMKFDYTINERDLILKRKIIFKTTRKFYLEYAGLSPAEIAGYIHTVIHDVLLEGGPLC